MTNRTIDIKRVEVNPTEPVSLDEVKDKLIITSTDDDDLLTDLIISCRKMIENSCNISLVPKTITWFVDLSKEWEFPYGPVTGLLSVQTRTGGEGSGPGTYATLESGWTTDGDEFLSFIPSDVSGFNPGRPFTGHFEWGPYASTNSRNWTRYKLVYTAGYTQVPQDLIDAIIAQVAYEYENRGERNDSNNGICSAAENKAASHRRKLWF